MNATNRPIQLAAACSLLLGAIGCSVDTSQSTEQTQEEWRAQNGVPRSLAQAKAEALEEAASELREALGDLRHEHQSHEAETKLLREIQELDSQARFFRALDHHH